MQTIDTFWHRSSVIYTFRSTYPYNTVKAFFWKAFNGEYRNWVRTEFIKPITIVNDEQVAKICYRNGIIVYKKQTGMDETVIACTTLNGTSTFSCNPNW